MKLCSLFDGSGGFPLAGSLCGITPAIASEVEPYPIAVTTSRFPNMRHLGDVSKINGAEIEPVNIITFGSPCQDLSVAGKRAGLKHEANGDEETTRSGLFMEAVRIIKEMRKATNGLYPDFAIWENVPGAFSSNSGDDFRVVLEELIKICEPGASVPSPEKGKWPYSDAYVGDGWSLSYRTLDAQHWGVPQRRRRIYLVLDLRGERAHKVLFEREGLRGYFEKGRETWQGTAADAENRPGTADREGTGNGVAYTLKIRSGCTVDSAGKAAGKGALIQKDKAATLAVSQDQYLFQPTAYGVTTKGNGDAFISEERHTALATGGGQPGQGYPCAMVAKGFDRYNQCLTGDVSETLRTPGGGDNYPTVVYSIENHPADSRVDIDESGKVQTLTSRMGTGGGNVPMVMEQHVYESHPMDSRIRELDDVAPTVSRKWHKGAADTPLVCEKHPTVCLEGNGSRPSHKGDGYRESDTMYTLNTTEQHAVCYPIHDQATRFSGKRGDKSDGNGNGLGVGEAGDPMNTLTSGDRHAVAYATDVGFFNSIENQSPTLLARSYKDPHLVTYPADSVRYIVRRLTPTECARLQGFPDTWGHIDTKETLTDDEYKFWHEVRNTHAAINGKQVKQYTKDQMLTWYNKLHTDSAEYKMWGNGIALPTALYVMQGIADALNAERKATNETKESETMEYNNEVTMEKLTTIQKRENLNVVYRTGEPGPGGAYHDYCIYPADCSLIETAEPIASIEFQRGPRKAPDSRHGVIDSDLLEIVRDRLRAFCGGELPCWETQQALAHVEAALVALNKRVEDRINRRVLGTMEK